MSDIELYDQKSKAAAAILAFFFGGIGVHRFYLGQTGRGIAHLLLFWTFIPFIIGFVDFIGFLSMGNDQFDRKYNPQLYERRRLNAPPKAWGNIKLPSPDAEHQVRPQQAPMSEHDRLLNEVTEIRNDIIRRIQSSKEFKSGIVGEIKPLVDNYIGQVRELIDRDKQIRKVVEHNPLESIDEKIFELNSKMQATTSEPLKAEYKHALDRHVQHKNSLREFYDQREMIALRLDSTLMSLREVKFDLLRLENLNSDEQRHEFFRMFDDKSNELSIYLSSLKQAYSENKLL